MPDESPGFGPLEELSINTANDMDIFPLPDSNITSPSICIKKHQHSEIESDPYISNREEITDE